jgi:hypothetical protein
VSVPASTSIANTQRFHIGRIPFNIIEHWAFKGFVKALSPSFEKSLFKKDALRRTHLDEVYKDTVETTDAVLELIPGKETIIVDGFKDRNGRHVINISKAKPGFASYLKTSWFGQRTHKGATYAAEVEKCITPKTLAVCADNTTPRPAIGSTSRGAWRTRARWKPLQTRRPRSARARRRAADTSPSQISTVPS